MEDQRCGFIGIIGRPNVGKSTLLNRVIGQKISITTHKPQTTRNRILGIRTDQNTQMIFMDTPGIHQSSKLLNQRLVQYAIQALEEADLNLLMIEPILPHLQSLHEEDYLALEFLGNRHKTTVVVINKIDTVPKEQILRTIAVCDKIGPFSEIVPISALKKDNLETLIDLIKKALPSGHFYFEEDQITDASERFLAGEFVREELFLRLKQELPYSIAVEVESFQETEKCIHIHCTIYVERHSQKGIIIGAGGETLKQIGSAARKKIEHLLGNQVFLSLNVKLLKKWSTDPKLLNNLGFY